MAERVSYWMALLQAAPSTISPWANLVVEFELPSHWKPFKRRSWLARHKRIALLEVDAELVCWDSMRHETPLWLRKYMWMVP